MVDQHNGGKNEKREVASVCGFHKLEQSLSEGSFPPSSNRPTGRCNSESSLDEFLGCLLGIPPKTTSPERLRKDSFCTPIGNYHYKVMPFGLKNAGSTYQRMMTKMFEPQLGKSIEVYIDDMVVKSKVESEHMVWEHF